MPAKRFTFTVRRLLAIMSVVAIALCLLVVKYDHRIRLVNQPKVLVPAGHSVSVVHKTKTIGFNQPSVLVKDADVLEAVWDGEYTTILIKVRGFEKLNLWQQGDENVEVLTFFFVI